MFTVLPEATVKAMKPADRAAYNEAYNVYLRELLANKSLAARINGEGELEFGVTEFREKGTKDAKDKGSKGGSLRITLGKSNIYPTVAMVKKLIAEGDKVMAFIDAHPEISR